MHSRLTLIQLLHFIVIVYRQLKCTFYIFQSNPNGSNNNSEDLTLAPGEYRRLWLIVSNFFMTFV